MPIRIEEAIPDLAFWRNATRLSITDVDGNIIRNSDHLSPIEQARVQAERARNSLNQLAPSIYVTLSHLKIDPADRHALEAIISAGGEPARELSRLNACGGFAKLSASGKQKALKLFLTPERLALMLLMVDTFSYQLVSPGLMEKALDLLPDLHGPLVDLASTGCLQKPSLLTSISNTEFEIKAGKILDLYTMLTSPTGRARLVELSGYWYVLYDKTAWVIKVIIVQSMFYTD